MTAPQTGDLFAVRTSGLIPWMIRKLTRSRYNHCGVWLGGASIGEAESGGFEIVANHYDAADLLTIPMGMAARSAEIVTAARRLTGTPYNFLDIAALAISLSTGRKTPAFIERRLSSPKRLICSQAVDQLYLDLGVRLFTDGRLPGQVTPGDIASLAPRS